MAQALIARETIDGAEVSRLVDQAYGRPVHDQLVVPSFANAPVNGHGDPEAFPGEAPASGISGPTSLQ